MNEVLFIINPPGLGIDDSSTFAPNSFKVTNSTEQNIVSVSLDVSTAIFPDLVYDPNGTAGDSAAKDLEIDSNPVTVGYVSRSFSAERDGGHDVLNLQFNDFGPGETVEFSIDIDPTSTKGAEQAQSKHYGSISGLELVGATAKVELADGTILQGQLSRIPDSDTGSQVTLTTDPGTAPTIAAVGFDAAATVTDAEQTIRVTGTPGAKVSLLAVEAALYIEDGFDIDEYEANTALSVDEFTATIGANGTVDIPVTLTRTDAASGGLNHFIAKYENSNKLSSTVVLELSSNAIAPTATLVAPELVDLSKPYTFKVTYTDNTAIDVTAIDRNDVIVTAPNGTVLPATLVSTEDTNGDGTVVSAIYSVAAPGGSWQSDRGGYKVAIAAGQVKDINGNAVAAVALGNFNLNFTHTASPTGVIRIEAEDYKAGTNGVEYFDKEVDNFGNAYRVNEGVDLEATGDTAGGGFNIGWTNPGEYLTYDVNIPKTSNYELVLRLANADNFNKKIDVVIGGQTYIAEVGTTGGFQDYVDVVLPNVALTAGIQELRLNIESENVNINYIQLEAKAPVIDKTAPTAKLDTTALIKQSNSAGAAVFAVTFTDNMAINSATIGADDITVTAPDGTTLPVTAIDVNTPGNGTPRTATYSVPAPGGKWDAADKGEYTVKINAGSVTDTNNNAIAASTLGKIAIDVPNNGSTTPGEVIRIEAENYKLGNNGIEYFDTSRRNYGGVHRRDDVDIEATGDTGGGHNVAWIEAGEHLTYDVDVAKAGKYNLVLRVATPAKDTKQVDVVIDGQTYTASFSNTGGWQTYQDVVINDVNLSAGSKELRLNMKSGGFNLNYVDLAVQQPVTPVTGAIRIEAEDYVEYQDEEIENFGKEYRPGEGVDIEVTGDEGGGYNIGWIKFGEYLTYDVDIPESRNYDVVLRVANPDPGSKQLDVVIGGKTYNATFASTGGFQTYTDVVINNVNLSAGFQELRLDMKSDNFNLNYIEIVPAKPVVDVEVPKVTFNNTLDNSDTVTLNLATNSTAKANFSVTYADNREIDPATIDASDITVTAPNGTVVPVTLTGTNGGRGKSHTAIYSIAAPGGTWDAADVGNYTVAVNAGAISDVSGNKTPAKTLGKLALNVLTPTSDGTIRINAGAGADTIDSAGKLWLADNYFTGGQAINPVYNPIDNTKDDFIYQFQRLGNQFSYSIPVDNGNYNVSLYFSELNFTNSDRRVFNVASEGNMALSNVDIYKSTRNAFLDGENDASIIKIPSLAIVRDGKLDLNFSSAIDQASLAGIEITPLKGAQVLIEESQQTTSVTEGGNSDTYQVLLNTKPTANVTINLQLDGQTTTDKTSLLFTPQNWNTPQTVTVNAVDDNLGESFHSSTIGHTISTSDTAYQNLTVPSVTANIIDNDSVPVKFKPQKEIDVIDDGYYGTTAGAWGSDGRLYVALASGLIKAYTFDDNYNILDTQDIDVIKGLSNPNITGIAFNPFENDGSQPKIYVAHNQFYANRDTYPQYGGSGFDELVDFSPYSGQVSVLEGPNFNTVTPLVQNIGVSNHDHGVNGLAFDDKGDLLITSGSNTNAGIADDSIGGIDESPFTATILKAEITKPNFNGNIQYQLPADWVAPEGLQIANPEQSQGFGGIVDVVPGVDVSVYAPGLRNSYDLVYATNGIIYATENDANTAFGDESLSATEQRPFTLDPLNELNIIKEGNYYGQPNRNRGEDDPRQNTYYPSQTPSNGEYTAPIEQFDKPVQGLVEYRSTAFGGQLKGNLLTQVFNGSLYNVQLSLDGTKTLNKNILEVDVVDDISGEIVKANPFYTKKLITEENRNEYNEKGLDVLTGFGGAIVGLNESDSRVAVIIPDDAKVTNMVAYEISDWRAPAKGGGQFTIGGTNFSGSLADTSVTIGGKNATVTNVSEKRIVGTFPSFELSDPVFGTTEYTEDKLLDITVASGGEESIITDAFQPLFV